MSEAKQSDRVVIHHPLHGYVRNLSPGVVFTTEIKEAKVLNREYAQTVCWRFEHPSEYKLQDAPEVE